MTVVTFAPLWSADRRIDAASNSRPPLKRGDQGRAVQLLQTALIQQGAAIPSAQGAAGPTQLFGLETERAVRVFQDRLPIGTDGVAGRATIGFLDIMMRGWSDGANGGAWGAALALTAAPRALIKVDKALEALRAAKESLSDSVTTDALQVHFKLVSNGVEKQSFEDRITTAKLDFIIGRYKGIKRTLSNPKMFKSSIPINGINTVAEAPFGGPITFGPYYSNVDIGISNSPNITQIGPESRAAVLIHEATHVIDFNSGLDQIHVSEFDPRYERQIAINARENPSAYATFAHHIEQGRDIPSLRPGLGAAQDS